MYISCTFVTSLPGICMSIHTVDTHREEPSLGVFIAYYIQKGQAQLLPTRLRHSSCSVSELSVTCLPLTGKLPNPLNAMKFQIARPPRAHGYVAGLHGQSQFQVSVLTRRSASALDKLVRYRSQVLGAAGGAGSAAVAILAQLGHHVPGIV